MISRRTLLGAASASALAVLPTAKLVAQTKLFPNVPSSAANIVARRCAIGAGGQFMNAGFSDDGTQVVVADTQGGYLWSVAQNKWIDICTFSNGIPFTGFHGNCIPMTISPTNSQIIYCMAERASSAVYTLYRSSNQGGSWTERATSGVSWGNQFTGPRESNYHLQVDPHNHDVVLLGTNGDTSINKGIWITRDGGATMTKCSGIAIDNGFYGNLVIFDRSSTPMTIGGQLCCSVAYVAVWGTGVYKTVDGCQTWNLISGSPNNVRTMRMAHWNSAYAGNLWCIDVNNAVRRYTSGGGFVQVVWPTGMAHRYQEEGTNVVAAFVAPQSDGWMMLSGCAGGGGGLSMARIRGDGAAVAIGTVYGPYRAWTGKDYYNWIINVPANEPGYLINVLPNNNLNIIGIECDPISGDIFNYGAQSIWRFTPPATFPRSDRNTYTLTSQGRGTDNTIVCDFLRPPGSPSHLIISCQDLGMLSQGANNTYPTTSAPIYSTLNCDTMDYASSDSSCVIGGASTASSYFKSVILKSTSYGAAGTIAPVPNPPSPLLNGAYCVAIATPSNFVVVGGFQNGGATNPHVRYTTDGGATWNIPAGLPTGNQYYVADVVTSARLVCADRVNIGTFYLNIRTVGIYKSSDGGASWNLQSASTAYASILSHSQCRMRSIPGIAGGIVVSFLTDFSVLGTNNGFATPGGIFKMPVRFLPSGGMSELGIGATKPGASCPRIWFRSVAGAAGGWILYYTDDFDVLFSGRSPKLTAGVYTGLYTDQSHNIRGLNGDSVDYRKVYWGTNGYGAYEAEVA